MGPRIPSTRPEAGAIEQAIIMIEATIRRSVRRLTSQMPLSREARAVTGRLKDFSDRDHVRLQQISTASWRETGDQRCPRRCAFGVVIKLRPAYSRLSKLIEIRCVDLAPIATEVREPHIVRHDEDDIGLF